MPSQSTTCRFVALQECITEASVVALTSGFLAIQREFKSGPPDSRLPKSFRANDFKPLVRTDEKATKRQTIIYTELTSQVERDGDPTRVTIKL